MSVRFWIGGHERPVTTCALRDLNRGRAPTPGFNRVIYSLSLPADECLAIIIPIYDEMRDEAQRYNDLDSPAERRVDALGWPPFEVLVGSDPALASAWLIESGQASLLLDEWFLRHHPSGPETHCWIDGIDSIEWGRGEVRFSGPALVPG